MPKRSLHMQSAKNEAKDEARNRARNKAGDGGQAAIEFAGLIALLLFVALAAIQLGLAAYAVQQAGTASRAAARAASQYDYDYQAVGKASMSDWLADGADIDSAWCFADEVEVTARVDVPSILPDVFDFDDAERSTTMPCD
ncbi:TadE/TadG family type IV pilus assembly protein [Streptomyces niveus]|uniref:TadE/TadG family type IV pilus assembly protein n=1 Tax=Streptomyces niveus TaxID=193462 RepID=UPI003446AAF2